MLRRRPAGYWREIVAKSPYSAENENRRRCIVNIWRSGSYQQSIWRKRVEKWRLFMMRREINLTEAIIINGGILFYS